MPNLPDLQPHPSRQELEDNADEVKGKEDLPEPIDSSDGGEPDTFRCTSCAWEVIQGICQACGLEHAYDAEREDEIYRHIHGSISTAETLAHSDRQLTPRGTTPLLEVETFIVPPEYRQSREDEFRALLARGASRLMCETFHLEYASEGGIVAWADTDLFEEFSGPRMKEGHCWKICLGRRIILDEDDADGSQFIEGLVEEAMVFPISESSKKPWGKWETLLEKNAEDNIWVTRPVSGAFPGPYDDDEMTIDEDEDEDEDDSETSSDGDDSSQADSNDESDTVQSTKPDESDEPDEPEEALITNAYEDSDIGSDEMEVDFEPAWYEPEDQDYQEPGEHEKHDAIDVEPVLPEDEVSESSEDSDYDLDAESSGDEVL
ncbi:hypothetical protein EVG20_g3762 [Dentipellis fragilis]|uniref:DUF8191 domain-containing protein n=1 Tax=Dentipellis fragilis TaxID=205917 RepID=A0A4Y9Z050_9AGAM|nr:hypothetical protein EVG20_g3762 [Dentipellis fragilis]